MTTGSGTTAAVDALRRELRAKPPAAFGALDGADLDELTRMLHAARQAEIAALVEATDQGLAFIPRVLRGTVKKVLFG